MHVFWNILEGIGIAAAVVVGSGVLATVAIILILAIASENGQNPFR